MYRFIVVVVQSRYLGASGARSFVLSILTISDKQCLKLSQNIIFSLNCINFSLTVFDVVVGQTTVVLRFQLRNNLVYINFKSILYFHC